MPYLAVDILQVTGTLSVAVAWNIGKQKFEDCRRKILTSSVLGTGSTVTLLGHRDKVKSAVKTTRQLGKVDVEGELVAHELEHLIVVGILHHVQARANIGGVLSLGDKLQSERVTSSSDTVGLGVFGTLNLAVCCAALVVRARGRVPLVAVIAVGIAALDVQPSPVGIDDNLAIDIGAAVTAFSTASLPRHLRMSLRLLSADTLGHDGRGRKEGHNGLDGK